jgi:cytosine/adenosine deaminase-related metal-dependent hydrolase
MRMAASLPGTRVFPETLAAFEVLRMMTWDGAKALGLAGEEGLVAGAPADFAILDPEAGWSMPVEWAEEPYGAIVYSMGRDNVAATVVDGVVR